MKSSRLLLSLASVLALSAHPMGNFSVNHYSRVAVGPRGADGLYVLVLAEIPTFQLLQQWKLERASPKEDLDRRAAAQARDWMHRLKITVNGRDVTPQFQSAELKIADGAGGVPIARIAARLRLPVAAGKLEFEDTNYPDRAGWKEIVITAAKGASIEHASQSDRDRSQVLTAYPQDPAVPPPQALPAAAAWTPPDPTLPAH